MSPLRCPAAEHPFLIAVNFLTPSYNWTVVLASIVVGTLASYVALALAERVRGNDRSIALTWWIGGSLAMGTGIWAMHFFGMLAFSLSIDLGYTRMLTLASWFAAVVASGVALGVTSSEKLTAVRLLVGSTAMATGICAMHYLGMAAIDVAPGIVWDRLLVCASVVIALVASAAALLIFAWLRKSAVSRPPPVMYGLRIASAVVMGLAISGMHYTGMAAAGFPENSVCFSSGELGGEGLGVLVGVSAMLVLTLTLFTALLDSRMQSKTARMAESLLLANRQLQLANLELQQRALHDPLTGLPNRVLFEDRLAHAVARSDRDANGGLPQTAIKIAVHFIDFDGFKPVNDSFGHAVGDQLLKEAANRLRATARASDTLARVGGDEFLLLSEGVSASAEATQQADRVLQALARPFRLEEREIHISCSIGVVVYPDHGPADRLIAQADAAMYSAKQGGGAAYALYESYMESDARVQIEMQGDLRIALANRELELFYQPKINAASGALSGAEALLRWHHPARGAVPPDVFIPLAERFGLILDIGDWVIDEACRQMRVWADAGLTVNVAINVSSHQLSQRDLVGRIETALRRYRIEPSQLMCEITESVAMSNLARTQQTFEGLARIGVYLSIDDFGTGHSSLASLRQLPARQLKIDRSFVRDIDSSADARAVVDAVVRLAHALGLSVVAEGVETVGQRDVLLELDCNELQGYFFARPMPAKEMAALLRRPGGSDPQYLRRTDRLAHQA